MKYGKTNLWIDTFLLAGTGFFMPVMRWPVAWLIALLIVHRIVIWDWHYLKNALKSPGIFLLPTFYIAGALGMMITDDRAAGLFDLQVKASLIIFPILLPFTANMPARNKRLISLSLPAGCLTAFLFMLILALMHYQEEPDIKIFFYKQLSPVIHPAYLAMFVSFSVMLVFNDWLHAGRMKRKYQVIYLMIILVLLAFAVMLASKAGILSMLLCCGAGSLWYLSKRGNWTVAFALFLAMLVAVTVMYRQSRYFRTRLSEMVDVLGGNNPADNDYGRMPIWKAAWYCYEQHPVFGTGGGDVRNELYNHYVDIGFEKGIKLHLNAHNQYLQTANASGIPGVLLLLAAIIWPLIISFRKRRWLIVVFILLIAMNFMFESMLETQAGVVFFAYFYALFESTVLETGLSGKETKQINL